MPVTPPSQVSKFWICLQSVCLSLSWTSSLIWVQSVPGFSGSLALSCLSNTGSLCLTATHWTLQGPHIHKGMFGWIHYTATHTACLPVWLHNSNLTSKLGQGGSCTTWRLDSGQGGNQRRGNASRTMTGLGRWLSESLKIVKNNNCTQCHLGDIGVATLTAAISLRAIRSAKASQTAQNMNTLFEAIGLLRLSPSTLSLSKLL